MSVFLFWLAVGFASGVVFASFFEWVLHRFVMHKPLRFFPYPFQAHAVVHHREFKADHTYHDVTGQKKDIIPMAWWNGPVLVAACAVPFLVAAWWTGRWPLLWGGLAACACYYATYEYLP